MATLPETAPIPSREPADIRMLRGLLHRWPFPRGKGALVRALSPLWKKREFLLAVEPGVFVPAELDDYMVRWVFVNGYHRDAVVKLSRELIRPGDTVIDIGANIGLWSMGAARAVGSTGSIHAIEPIAENYARLLSNLELNGFSNVRATQLACSNESGSVTMYRPSYDNSGHPTLGRRDGVDTPVSVTAVTLDDYCDRNALARVDFIKIDVEGAERLVFSGAARTLSSTEAPAILFEVNEETARKLGSTTADAKRILAAAGYEIFELVGRQLVSVELDRLEEPGDLFAFKPHHYVRFPRLIQMGCRDKA